MLNDQKHIILFDGVCNLCDTTVQFVNKHDAKNQFLYQSLQSSEASELMSQFDYKPEGLQSIVLISNNQLFSKSTAALKIAGLLGFPYSLAEILLVIPKPIRDTVYQWVAKNRYRWFGQKDVCEFDPSFKQKIYGTSTN